VGKQLERAEAEQTYRGQAFLERLLVIFGRAGCLLEESLDLFTRLRQRCMLPDLLQRAAALIESLADAFEAGDLPGGDRIALLLQERGQHAGQLALEGRGADQPREPREKRHVSGRRFRKRLVV